MGEYFKAKVYTIWVHGPSQRAQYPLIKEQTKLKRPLEALMELGFQASLLCGGPKRLSSWVDTLYTFGDNITHYKTEV